MEITHTTVPGVGVLHHFQTRGGQRFGVLVYHADRRELLIYGPEDPDVPTQRIPLDQDEADQVAELLHSQPVADRLANLERRVAQMLGGTT